MKLDDLSKTSNGREYLNTILLPKLADECKNGDSVLYVGIDSVWDYKPLFQNPKRWCYFETIDSNSSLHPDIVGNIEEMPQVESNKYSLVIVIGIYEFLHRVSKAFDEIKRILKDGGILLIAFPGKGYRDYGIPKEDFLPILSQYRVLDVHFIYEHEQEPSSIIVTAKKI